ncbi:hypothetical protein BJM39_27435 [Salmonella enterica subsp. enterica serovar Javiana]|nr:hypothetical protein BJM39_27435 [Salmonella enterica subsp. enterica serovar Javiana]
MTRIEALGRALDDLDATGGTWPCRNRNEWISDDAEERAEAAEACQHCPVLEICAAVATTKPFPTHGVWGGRDLTPMPKRKAA